MLISRCPSAFDQHKIGICQTDRPVAGHGRSRGNRPIPVTGQSIDASLIWILKDIFLCLPVFAVLDDEDSNNITAGSIVTVTVTLTRKRMAVRND